MQALAARLTTSLLQNLRLSHKMCQHPRQAHPLTICLPRSLPHQDPHPPPVAALMVTLVLMAAAIARLLVARQPALAVIQVEVVLGVALATQALHLLPRL